VVSFIDMMPIDLRASSTSCLHKAPLCFLGDMLDFYAKYIQRQPCPSRNLAFFFFFRALVLLPPFIEYGAQSIVTTGKLELIQAKMPISEIFQVGLLLYLSSPAAKKALSTKTSFGQSNHEMRLLARRAILLIVFVVVTTLLYGLTTKFSFTAPNYDDVSIDPEGGNYYDYGSKVATAVWRGAGHWIGMTEPSSTNATVLSGEYTIAKSEHRGQEQNSSESNALDPESMSVATAHGETTSRRQRLRSRRGDLRPQH
jgi:hypothetical protein